MMLYYTYLLIQRYDVLSNIPKLYIIILYILLNYNIILLYNNLISKLYINIYL